MLKNWVIKNTKINKYFHSKKKKGQEKMSKTVFEGINAMLFFCPFFGCDVNGVIFIFKKSNLHQPFF